MGLQSYTSQQYLKLIEDFCEWKGFTDKQKAYLLRPNVYERNLFDLKPDEYKKLLLNMCGKSQNSQYLLENKCYLNNFLEWAVENGYMKSNPFETEPELSINELIKAQIELLNMDILYPEDIRKIMEKIPYNKNYYGMLIYGFYEGICNAKEFSRIQVSDIDFDKNIIRLDKRVFEGSKTLFSYIKGYIKETEYVRIRYRSDHSGDPLSIDYIYLIKVGDNLIKNNLYKRKNESEYIENIDIEKNKVMIQKRISKDIKTLQKTLELYGYKNIELSIDMINKSGFINFARKQLHEYNDAEFCELFIGTDSSKKNEWCQKLEKIGRRFGETVKGHVIRRNYRLYIMRSKYYF